MSDRLGFAGQIARRFLTTEITPLLALVGLLLGVFAVLGTPREEEPQINVTFANVFIPFPGASAREVEHLVASPAEQVMSELEGVKHVYSVSRPGMAVLTVQFQVGENRTDAIVRLYNKVASNVDWLPENVGVGQPIIKPKGIDDVPIVSATLWSEDSSIGAYELGKVAHAIEAELKRVPGTRDIYTIGEPQRSVQVLLDPQALSGYGIPLDNLRNALLSANHTADNLAVTAFNRELLVQAGTFLTTPEEVGSLMVGTHGDKPVFLRDVAQILDGPETPQSYVWIGSGPGATETAVLDSTRPAVTIAIAKKPGTNAVKIAKRIIDRFEDLKGTLISDSVNITITRDYGVTADSKAKKLIQKLTFATLSVIALVWVALGLKEAAVVGAAVVVTLLITLFASWAWGFTLNRVSLFALIFSIGILVDDAIAGGPTILATFTVIAALLPMAFVTGLMGPYMSPIPINASMGMLISLAVAFVFTPWATNKALAKVDLGAHHGGHDEGGNGKLVRFFTKVMSPFVDERKGRRNRWYLLGVIMLLIALSIGLGGVKLVVLKMLPFDNKSEFQIVLDMPEGSALEKTTQVLSEIGDYLETVPEVKNYQAYSGTSAPISFNGLVRQYYLREGAYLGDIQVNLVDNEERDRKSHEVALSVREPVQQIARAYGGNAKIVEVPPGPPVMSPIVAEIYGIDYEGQVAAARKVRETFEQTDDIVDIDDSIVQSTIARDAPADKRVIVVDREKATRLGVTQSTIARALQTVLQGEDVTYLHGETSKYAVPIRLMYSEADKSDLDQVLSLRLQSRGGSLIPLSEIVTVIGEERENAIYHKDLLPVVYVTADMAGELDSPLYGLFGISAKLSESGELEQWFIDQPPNPYDYSLKWDGEWQVTYETFRDMGLAYAVGLILIYLLVVAQFSSYLVPLVIMAPIPLTIIGIMPGHALLGAQFTATSMIGMIALAGIIVRNSILLVDFINQQVREGMEFREAVINSAAVRAQPIVLTAMAAMAGGFFILDDPIFSGLAVSLIFGLLISTILTLVVIPVVYYAAMQNKLDQIKA
ncbi:MAG: efflux RND transporter permease subunit [Gammaproteobacteria bacterium]